MRRRKMNPILRWLIIATVVVVATFGALEVVENGLSFENPYKGLKERVQKK